jgi:hypothetical protein
MKKSIILTYLFAFLAYAATAQLSGGLKVGGNMHRFTEEGSDDSGSELEEGFKQGLQVSAVLEMGLTEKFALRIEPGLTQKGAKSTYDGTIDGLVTKSDSKLSLNYLEVPILGKFSFSGNENSLYLLAGPSFGILSSGKYKGFVEVGGFRTEIDEDIEFAENDGINRFEVAAAVGLGYQLGLGSGKLFVDARFQQGLTSYVDNEGESDYKPRNQGILLNLGYVFSF